MKFSQYFKLVSAETKEVKNILSKHTNKTWLKKALESGSVYEGPNGNEVCAYVWAWKWGVKLDKDGEEVEAKVSNWNMCEMCTDCKRRIVYIFYVYDKEKKDILPYGFDHVHKALGIKKELSKAMIEKIKKIVSIPDGQKELSKLDENRVAEVLKIYNRTAAPSVKEAIDNLKEYYSIYVPRNEDIPVYYNKQDKKYVGLFGKKITEALLGRVEKILHSFSRIPPAEVRISYRVDQLKALMREIAKSSAAESTNFFIEKDLKFSDKYMWAVNFKDKLISRIIRNSIAEDEELWKRLPDWKVGGSELAEKFRKISGFNVNN